MNLVVALRHVLLGLPFGDSLVRALDAIVQAANAWASAQHNADGTHAAMTASSVTVAGTVTAGMFNRAVTLTWVTDVTVTGTYLQAPARNPYIKVLSSAGPVRIDGLDIQHYQLGDQVTLANASDDGGATGNDLTVRLQSTSAPTDGRFRGNPGTPNTDITLKVGRMMILTMDGDISGPRRYWRVSMF